MSVTTNSKTVPRDKYSNAIQFYEDKLGVNPAMPRYNHCMAAIHSEKKNYDIADNYYRQTILATPHDIMARNDFALHLAKQNRKEDALQEFRKAALIVEDNAFLQKNIAAVQGNSGQYKLALESATRARHLNPYDPMNHRNLAKLHAALGDSRSALEHNMTSIQLEKPVAPSAVSGYNSGPKPVTSAYRAAAVQIIAKGGSRDEAFRLMDIARTLENKTYTLDTTQRTNEIIYSAMKRMGSKMSALEKERAAEEDKKRVQEMRFDSKEDILKFSAAEAAHASAGERRDDDEDGNKGERRKRRQQQPPR